MLRALLRILLALLGAAASAIAVALIEARVVATASADARVGAGAVFTAELGVLLPLALAVGGAVGVGLVALEPQGPRSPSDHLAELRAGPVLARLRSAALSPLVVFAAFAWTLGSAYVARSALASGRPAEAGLTVGAATLGLLLATLAVAAALLPVVRRLLAIGSSVVPALLDPALTGGLALLVAGGLLALSVATGDTSGAGGVAGIFGVLRRTELDLRPVANAALLTAGAYLAPIAFARAPSKERWTARPSAFVGSGLAVVVVLLSLGLLAHAADVLDREPLLAAAIEKHAPLGKASLAALRRVTDHDRDGFSGRFGGGDCDDRDARVNPSAVDVPGNGLDEDCTGEDTPAASEPEREVGPSDRPRAAARRRPLNVLLITVDTLRVDLGFMGYPRPVSPNLDALAEKSTVFERAYAMASYTGKSVGPMLIGKYPSETQRNWSHFDTYAPSNVFVAERAKEAFVRTFAGHCHWYFRHPTGLRQGFDVWDVSAIPPGMGDNDNTVTSDRMSDLGLRLLSAPDNTSPGSPPAAPVADAGGAAREADAGVATAVTTFDAGGGERRFFGWLHFFDPHAQYVAHEAAPVFTGGSQAKDLYDQEVWFTDKHIGRVLDYVASQPWGAETAIVVTADHGEAFGEHGMGWHGREIWEPLVRVPLVVHVPGEQPRRVAEKRSQIDIAPTVLDLLGVELPGGEELRGKSLLADVLLPEGAVHEERDVYIDMPAGPFNGVRRALITGESPGTKLVHLGGGMYQLFDLATDPGELKDLSADRERLRAAIQRMQQLRGRLKEIEVKPEEK